MIKAITMYGDLIVSGGVDSVLRFWKVEKGLIVKLRLKE